MPNLELNFGPVRQSSGSNLSSEPNCGNPNCKTVYCLIKITMSTTNGNIQGEEALDLDDEPKTYTFVAATLANCISSTLEMELFDSGAS